MSDDDELLALARKAELDRARRLSYGEENAEFRVILKAEAEFLDAARERLPAQIERHRAEVEALRAENDILRGIAARVMPCHYCGATEIAKCPHGFPGCALADDLFVADQSQCAHLRAEVAALRREIEVLRHYGNSACTHMADQALAIERAGGERAMG